MSNRYSLIAEDQFEYFEKKAFADIFFGLSPISISTYIQEYKLWVKPNASFMCQNYLFEIIVYVECDREISNRNDSGQTKSSTEGVFNA